jgi:hypothetical protein
MSITNIIEKETSFEATIDGTIAFVPKAEGNRHYVMILEAIANGEPVTQYVQPPSPIPNLTFSQLLIGLVSEEWITEAEGTAWLTGTPPTLVENLISSLPLDQQFAAKARAIRPSVIIRTDPLVGALANLANKTPEELDTFFRTYSII